MTIDLQGYRMGSLNEGFSSGRSEREPSERRAMTTRGSAIVRSPLSRSRSAHASAASCRRPLEDIDSINFALGLRHFDPALHQPHPPGYPVFIALGRLSLALIVVVAPAMPQVHAEALALAVWSAIGGALAIAAAARLFLAIARIGGRSLTYRHR